MLDAFGKGASDDIRAAKEELYNQVLIWRPPSLAGAASRAQIKSVMLREGAVGRVPLISSTGGASGKCSRQG